MSETIGLRDLRQNIGPVMDRVRAGERLVVTDHNKPIAELVPLGTPPGLARLVAAGRVSPPAAPLDLSPVTLNSRRGAATRALEDVRGQHLF